MKGRLGGLKIKISPSEISIPKDQHKPIDKAGSFFGKPCATGDANPTLGDTAVRADISVGVDAGQPSTFEAQLDAMESRIFAFLDAEDVYEVAGAERKTLRLSLKPTAE